MPEEDPEPAAQPAARRMAEFQRRLAAEGLEAYWVVQAANVRYLSGFTGQDSTLLVAEGRSVLVTDSRYVEQAERECVADEVLSRHAGMAATVASLCKRLGVRRLAVTSANVTHGQFEALGQEAPSLRLDARKSGIAEEMRQRKSPEEVQAIRDSLRTAEQAFLAVLPQVQPGRTERELAARLEYEMKLRGAEDASFDTICAVGARASVPHAATGDGVVSADCAVLFDWGARRDGYCSDLTRTLATGRIPALIERPTEVVLEAQQAVLERLKPGNTCGDADAAGRSVIVRSGYGHLFGHAVGHGVGLVVHEEPRLGPRGEAVLLPGMVVTVEPGIYLPGEFGVRIEEMVLITSGEPEVLTTLPRQPAGLRPASAAGAT